MNKKIFLIYMFLLIIPNIFCMEIFDTDKEAIEADQIYKNNLLPELEKLGYDVKSVEFTNIFSRIHYDFFPTISSSDYVIRFTPDGDLPQIQEILKSSGILKRIDENLRPIFDNIKKYIGAQILISAPTYEKILEQELLNSFQNINEIIIKFLLENRIKELLEGKGVFPEDLQYFSRALFDQYRDEISSLKKSDILTRSLDNIFPKDSKFYNFLQNRLKQLSSPGVGLDLQETNLFLLEIKKLKNMLDYPIFFNVSIENLKNPIWFMEYSVERYKNLDRDFAIPIKSLSIKYEEAKKLYEELFLDTSKINSIKNNLGLKVIEEYFLVKKKFEIIDSSIDESIKFVLQGGLGGVSGRIGEYIYKFKDFSIWIGNYNFAFTQVNIKNFDSIITEKYEKYLKHIAKYKSFFVGSGSKFLEKIDNFCNEIISEIEQTKTNYKKFLDSFRELYPEVFKFEETSSEDELIELSNQIFPERKNLQLQVIKKFDPIDYKNIANYVIAPELIKLFFAIKAKISSQIKIPNSGEYKKILERNIIDKLYNLNGEIQFKITKL